jgi:hypothetical protein
MPEATCQDCGAALVGRYCHACGLRAAEGRLRFADVGRWLFAKLLDTDRGLLLTVREMTLRPGATIRRYIAGQRGRFTNPFAYLFIGAALSLLAWTAGGDALTAGMAESMAKSVRSYGSMTDAQAARAGAALMKVVPYMAQIQLAMCIPLVLLLRLFFRRSGFTLAEISVFALFASGQVFFLDVVVTLALLALRASFTTHTNLTLLLYAVVFGHAAAGFFPGGRIKAVLKVELALLLAMAVYGVVQMVAIRLYVINTT